MKPQILVPFDFSDGARRALAWAADLHATTGGRPLHMVNAISSLPPGPPDLPVELVLPNQDEIEQLKRRMVEEEAKHGATATAEVAIRGSTLGDAILDVAKAKEAELIVMGTHGRTGVKRLFLGSVAEHVLRHADCPVVTIRGHRLA